MLKHNAYYLQSSLQIIADLTSISRHITFHANIKKVWSHNKRISVLSSVLNIEIV